LARFWEGQNSFRASDLDPEFRVWLENEVSRQEQEYVRTRLYKRHRESVQNFLKAGQSGGGRNEASHDLSDFIQEEIKVASRVQQALGEIRNKRFEDMIRDPNLVNYVSREPRAEQRSVKDSKAQDQENEKRKQIPRGVTEKLRRWKILSGVGTFIALLLVTVKLFMIETGASGVPIFGKISIWVLAGAAGAGWLSGLVLKFLENYFRANRTTRSNPRSKSEKANEELKGTDKFTIPNAGTPDLTGRSELRTTATTTSEAVQASRAKSLQALMADVRSERDDILKIANEWPPAITILAGDARTTEWSSEWQNQTRGNSRTA
jgi:hypothetical protein